MTSVIIADDHPFLLRGTKHFLESNSFNVIGAYTNSIEALNSILAKKPTLAILDISMPGMDGLELAQKLTDNHSKTKIILLTMHNDLSIFNKAKSIGVNGYILKEFVETELITCIKNVLSSDYYFSSKLHTLIKNNSRNTTKSNWKELLTNSELKIIEQITLYKSNKEIADLFFISIRTVETHRRNIIKKLNLSSDKNALLMWGLKHLNV
ncbi:MAG: DNA-binding response regulator [Cytophagales bacterium]|nr:MAG: DNA-binding response regulator [Cytophagales bacterium]